SSGITVTDDCITAYHDLKLKKNAKYVIFKVADDNSHIAVDKVSKDPNYDEFVASLPTDDCRYAVYDFSFNSPDGGERQKLLIKPKMLYASSKGELRKRLDGINIEIQGTDFDEVSYNTVLEKVMRTTR
ncbi:hypothetical protein BB560_006743, partial [Smittium megazygosporum]